MSFRYGRLRQKNFIENGKKPGVKGFNAFSIKRLVRKNYVCICGNMYFVGFYCRF